MSYHTVYYNLTKRNSLILLHKNMRLVIYKDKTHQV